MKTQRGFGLFHVILIIVIAVIGGITWKSHLKQQAEVAAKAAIEKERAEIKKSLDDLKGLFDKWGDAEKLASSAPRIALATPVASLQEIKRQTAALKIAPCLEKAKAALVEGMSFRIDAYVSFMQQHSLVDEMAASSARFDEFTALMLVCKEK